MNRLLPKTGVQIMETEPAPGAKPFRGEIWVFLTT